MHPRLALRIALIAEFLCVIVSIAFSFTLQDALPPLLAEWLAQEDARDPTADEVLLGFVFVPILVGYLVAMVGLFLLQPWARWVYLGITVVVIPLSLLLGPTVQHALEATADGLATTLGGIVIGIAFFSGALERPPGGPEGELPW